MKKLTTLLIALVVAGFAVQAVAAPAKAPRRSTIFNELPDGFTQLGTTSIYYSVKARDAAGPGTQTGYCILGEIGGRYYSSTYEGDDVGWFNTTYGEGAGFIAAFQVGDNQAVYLNAATGTENNGVTMTSRIEPQGEVAARIVYTLTNNNATSVTISAGVWADIMIGNNDNAPIERLAHENDTYGLKLKYANTENTPLMCALFGAGVTGVTPADDYWFGQYRNNYEAYEIVGRYDSIYEHEYQTWYGGYYFENEVDENYMKENRNYDSGMGFCWKAKTIQPGNSIELSYVISVGEIDYEEPFVPGDDRFEYHVAAYDIAAWNDLTVPHPAHVYGYYEHPYGQEGYIEYMVDGNRGEWTRIETPLTSGEAFDLPFEMNFDPEITTTHTLQLRFNDGMDNYVPMDGLNWTDVRSFNIEGLEDRVYTGEPQTYEVTVGEETFTIGENGEYVEPGTYDYSIEGDFDQNTIGVNTVEFKIDKAQSEITYTVPEDCVYDGEAHAAIAQLVKGDGELTITYVNTKTGETSTEAPVEPGTYSVVVTVTETDHYYGLEETVGTFTIDKAQSEIEYTIPEDCVYDGEAHAATAQLVKGDGELTITYVNTKTGETSTEAPVEPGTYSVVVTVTETDHYYGLEETVGTFTIDKAQSEITYTVPEDCVYDGEAHAATAELVKGDGELTITYVNTETGETSTEAPVVPGTYDVVVTVTETDHYYGLEETVGTFTIKKAPCVYQVIVPESVEYDGEGHPATVIVTQGGEPIVTYLNTKNDKISADDPVDIGEYYVIVEIPETDLYEGLPSTMFGPFEIYSEATSLQEMGAAKEGDNAWYTIQGIRVPAPTAPGIYIHNGKKYIMK